MAGLEKIAAVIKPLFDEVKNELKNQAANNVQELKTQAANNVQEVKTHAVNNSQEILVAIARLEARMDLLEQLVSAKKKAISRTEKKPVADADPTKGPTTTTTTAPAKDEAIPINKMLYFKTMFKNDKTFRDRYLTPDLKTAVDANEYINGRTSESQKLTAQATYCWNEIKKNKPDVHEAIEKEYQAMKAAADAANKPPQQTIEQRTP